jgi:hypothetical protein
MSCGAALYNLRVSLRAAGRRAVVALFPDHARPELLATVEVGTVRVPTDDDRALAAAIPVRRTQRRAFATRPIAAAISDDFSAAAAREGAWLVRLVPPQKRALADLVADADQRQLGARKYRRELSRWLVPAWRARRDGIPLERKEYGSASPLAATALLRPSLGRRFGAIERSRIVGAPAVVVIGTERDDPAAWLACGQALEAVLLAATARGLAASFLNQVLELGDLRERVRVLARPGGHPHMILRLGHGAYEAPVPRRPLGEVLDER